jgi:putative flippase GtrA
MSDEGLLGQALRYGVAGLANMALGYGVILTLEFGLHLSHLLANFFGYAAGFALGFVLSRSFVFGAASDVRKTGPKYLAAVGAAYVLNLFVLEGARAVAPPTDLVHAASQLAAMGAYSATLFGLSRYWVFAGAATR